MEGTVGSSALSGDIGDDILIVTRHQYNDVTINDGLGSNTIKFDYGVEITSFVETSSFFGISSIAMNLASGATITVTNPAQQGQYQYQFGDEAAMDYAAFKTALGVDSATGTLTKPYVVDYPSEGPKIISIPDPVVDFSTYNHVTGTNAYSEELVGTSGNDYFYNLGSGIDDIYGYGGDDFFLSGGGEDTFLGYGGTDTISYANETSWVHISLSNEYAEISRLAGDFDKRDHLGSIENAVGSNFNDIIGGSSGANQLEGGGGNDELYGFGGNDILYGGSGNDTLDGFSGSDTYIGGTGKDIFTVYRENNTKDIIKDFNPTEGDQIELVRYGTVTNLDELYADAGIKIIEVTIEDYKNDGTLDTVLRFDRGSSGVDNTDYLFILEGFTDPILFDYFNLVTD